VEQCRSPLGTYKSFAVRQLSVSIEFSRFPPFFSSSQAHRHCRACRASNPPSPALPSQVLLRLDAPGASPRSCEGRRVPLSLPSAFFLPHTGSPLPSPPFTVADPFRSESGRLGLHQASPEPAEARGPLLPSSPALLRAAADAPSTAAAFRRRATDCVHLAAGRRSPRLGLGPLLPLDPSRGQADQPLAVAGAGQSARGSSPVLGSMAAGTHEPFLLFELFQVS
jgi:hypothetical protein